MQHHRARTGEVPRAATQIARSHETSHAPRFQHYCDATVLARSMSMDTVRRIVSGLLMVAGGSLIASALASSEL